jgi:S1-C subfamily serine protease
MFTRAVRTAAQFTYPYVGLRRRRCSHVYSTMGAFVILNAEGWVLTSSHLVDDIVAVEREVQEASGNLGDQVCTDHAEIWAVPGFGQTRPRLAEATVRQLADIALVRLEPFDPAVVAQFPRLRDVSREPIEQGMSICRLGYPFHDIAADWSAERHEFALGQDAFPVPSFALDGIVSRFHRVSSDAGLDPATFIETSTPGLRGQSGGPLLDVEGRVCGIQSHTTHLDLGFDAGFQAGETTVTERQFLNVGAATHISEVVALLDEVGVAYELG